MRNKRRGLVFLLLLSAGYWLFVFLGPREEPDVKMPCRDTGQMVLESTIDVFKEIRGRYPESLEELKEQGFLDEIPDSGDTPWDYTPEDGAIR